MSLTLGLGGTAALTVGPADLAPALHSGDVAVLGTPRLIALCEEAAVAAVASLLPPGQTTVGTRVELDHLAPALPGEGVEATARLEEVQGRRLTFEVAARAGSRLVARGHITRVMVDRAKFPGTPRA